MCVSTPLIRQGVERGGEQNNGKKEKGHGG